MHNEASKRAAPSEGAAASAADVSPSAGAIEPRYSRQIILAEVGLSGQARIEQASLLLPAELGLSAREMARRYARAAGLSGPEMTSSRPGLTRLARGFRHEPSRAIAEGALCALDSIQEALGR